MLFVLDLDDTLYLERDYVRSGFIAVGQWLSQHLGLDRFFENAWPLFEAGARGNIFDLVLKQFNIVSADLVQTLVRVYRGHMPDISLLPDAKNFLQMHRSESLALVSDGYSEAQWLKIRSLSLENHIGKMIVTGDSGKVFWKPNPWGYLAVQGELPAESCVYIGDNPLKDFKAPQALGWNPSFRIRREGSMHFNLPTPDSCIEVESFTEVHEGAFKR